MSQDFEPADAKINDRDDQVNRRNRDAMSLSGTVIGGVSKRGDYPVLPSKVALVVIDVQEYLSSPEGADTLATEDDEKNDHLYNVSLPKAVSNIRLLVNAFRKLRDETLPSRQYGSEVIFTYLEALTDDCRDVSLDYKLSGPKLAVLPGPSKPAKFLPELCPSTSIGRGDILIPKTSCSVFNSTNINYVLRNLQIEQLVICGQLTDQCVESATRDAADLGYFVTVAEDACAATGTSDHFKGLYGMKGFARIVPTEQILEELKANGTECSNIMGEDEPNRDGAIDGESNVSSNLDSVDKPVGADSPGFSIKQASDWSTTRDASVSGASKAVLRALRYAGVEFLRLAAVDVANSLRCKAVPINAIDSNHADLDRIVSFDDMCDEGNALTIYPDLGSLRVLPYAKKSAMAMGTLHDPRTGVLSPLCTRGLLLRVIDAAKDEFNLAFNVGAEIGFCLFREGECDVKDLLIDSVGNSLLSHPTTLNQQEDFMSDLYAHLEEQELDIELICAKDAACQLGLVLKPREDAMKLADDIILMRETISACANAYGMRVTFSLDALSTRAGKGVSLHVSLRESRSSNIERRGFRQKSIPASTSHLGESFLEGISENLAALLCVAMPFQSAGPEYWTGHSGSFCVKGKSSSMQNRSDLEPRAEIDVKLVLPGSTGNVYLEMALILAAGMHGLSRSLESRRAGVADDHPKLPQSIQESLEHLKKNEFLLSIMGDKLSAAIIASLEAEIEKSPIRR